MSCDHNGGCARWPSQPGRLTTGATEPTRAAAAWSDAADRRDVPRTTDAGAPGRPGWDGKLRGPAEIRQQPLESRTIDQPHCDPCSPQPAPVVPVLLLPGWQSSGPGHWQILWSQSHPDWQVVEFGDWQHPDPQAWRQALAAAIGACPSPPLLIAHSLGCLAAAGLLAEAGAPPIAAVLLVAPPDPGRPDTPAPLRPFHPVPRAPLGVPGKLLLSSDDPYASEAFALELARVWGLEPLRLGAMGHINADSGLGHWPQGLALAEALLARLSTDR